jgi:hypothetical protein
MTFAQGSRTRLALVEESSFGATPSNPSLTEIPYTSHSLNLTKERVQGNDILQDRIPRVDRHGNRSAAGDISVDLRDTDFDSLIESAFFSSFGTSGSASMTIGTSPKFFTIEDSANDITQFRQFTGMAVSQMAISIAPNQMVQATFSMVGKDMTQAQTALDGNPASPSGGEPFDSYSGSINEGGSSIAIITSLDFTLSNSLSPTNVVGSDTTPQLEFGRAVVEGTVTAYYEDETLIDKFLNETETSLDITLDDPSSGSTLQFEMNSVKYNGADVPVADPQSRIITIPFVAIYNAGDSSNIKVTKT